VGYSPSPSPRAKFVPDFPAFSPIDVIAIGRKLIGSLFSSNEDPYEEALNLQNQLRMLGIERPYQSPYASTIDPVAARALLA
jgi:hypothetical protein